MDRWAAFRVLCSALRPGSAWPAAADIPWPLVLELADQHLVTPALACKLGRDDAVPEDIREFFWAVGVLNRERNDSILRSTRHVAALLHGADVFAVVLKGAASLVEGLYPDPAARLIGDIDILVDGQQAHQALDALRQDGWAFATEEHTADRQPTTMPILSHPDHRAGIDLHMHLVKQAYRGILTTAEALAAARPAGADGSHVFTLSPAHRLVHIVANGQLHEDLHLLGRISLRRLLEFTLLAGAAPADAWGAVDAAFRRGGQEQELYRYAALSAALLGGEGIALPPPDRDPLIGLRRWIEHPAARNVSLRGILRNDLARIVTQPDLLLQLFRLKPWRLRLRRLWRGRSIRMR